MISPPARPDARNCPSRRTRCRPVPPPARAGRAASGGALGAHEASSARATSSRQCARGDAETMPVPSANHNPEPGAEARGPRAGVTAAGRRRYLPCALRGTTPAAAAPRKEHHGHAAAAPELLPPGPRRRWPLRRLRWPLRGRNPDAADPGGGAGLHGGAARPGLRRRMAPPPHPLRRPPEPALARRAPDRRTSTAPRSTSSATS